MTTYRTPNGFFIIKTITGNYIVGLNDDRYNNIETYEYGVFFNNTLIPSSAIEYFKRKIPYDEFVRTCKEAEIIDRIDVKETLMDFYDSQGMNPYYLKILRYMNDLRF